MSPDTARLIVLQGEKYLDWLPWDRVADRCSIYLHPKGDPRNRCGRPFVDLENTDTDVISRIVKIRNAIAHASDNARQKFVKDVIGNMMIPPQERTPAGFLRGFHAAGQTRLESYLDSIVTVAAKIIGRPIK